MAEITLQLPFYTLRGDSNSTGGWTLITMSMFDDDGNGGIDGHTHDQIAAALETALAGLTDVTSTDLDKHTETITQL